VWLHGYVTTAVAVKPQQKYTIIIIIIITGVPLTGA